MGRNRESEVRRQAFGDLRPRAPVRPTVVRASVVLLEERAVAGGVPRDFVNTLPPLRIRVREKTRPDAAVLHRPRASRVPGLEGADRADPDDEVLRFPWIDQDGMEAKTAAPRLPLLPCGVVVQGPDVLPRVAAILAAEERRGFDSRIDRVGLIRRTRLDVPHTTHCEVRPLFELRRGGGRFRFAPDSPAVHRGAPGFRAVRRGRVHGPPIPRVEAHVVHASTRQERARDGPFPPVRRMEKESAFLRPDCHDDAVFLDRSYHVNHPQRWARYARRPPASMPRWEAASSRGLRSRTSSHTDVVGQPRRQPDPGFPGTRNRAPSACRRGPMHRGRLRPLPPCTNGGRAGSARGHRSGRSLLPMRGT